MEHVENQRVCEGGKSGAGLPAQPEKDEPDHRGNAVNIEDEIMQMAMVLQQIKSSELRKAAIAQVKVLAEII